MNTSPLTGTLHPCRIGDPQEIARLVELLPDQPVLVPLSEPLIDDSIYIHLVTGIHDETLLPLFTEDQVLAGTGHRFDWTTDGKHLELAELPGRTVLEMALRQTESGDLFGAAINPYSETALDLRQDEIEGILGGDPRPLQRRLKHFPVHGDHEFYTGAEEEPDGSECTAVLDRYTATHPGLLRYRIARAELEDREKPMFHVLFYTDRPVDKDSLGNEIGQALQGKIPSFYGSIGVFFEDETGH